MTVATVIYYSGYHPYTLKPTKSPKTKQEKEEQHRFFFWYKKENQQWIRNVLSKVGRKDLLQKLMPENNSWRKNKDNKTKDTFNETVVFTSRKKKKFNKKNKRK
jgi:hypothetical protein